MQNRIKENISKTILKLPRIVEKKGLTSIYEYIVYVKLLPRAH